MNELMPIRRGLSPFWEQFSSMERELTKLFDDPFFSDLARFPSTRTSSLPKLNIKEEKDKYVVEIAIPGYKKDSVNIEVKDNKLYIEGKSENKKEEKDDEKYIFRELSKRSFHRIVPFPKKIDEEKATATFENGIVLVDIAKKQANEQENRKKIKIK